MDFIDYCLLSQLFFSVRNPEGQIKLYSKGADTILFERLHPSNEDLLTLTSDHLSVSAPAVRLAQWPFGSFLWLGLLFKISTKWSDFWNRKCVENGSTGNCASEHLETGTWTHPLPCWASGQSLQGGWTHSWWEIATEYGLLNSGQGMTQDTKGNLLWLPYSWGLFHLDDWTGFSEEELENCFPLGSDVSGTNLSGTLRVTPLHPGDSLGSCLYGERKIIFVANFLL